MRVAKDDPEGSSYGWRRASSSSLSGHYDPLRMTAVVVPEFPFMAEMTSPYLCSTQVSLRRWPQRSLEGLIAEEFMYIVIVMTIELA